MTHKLWTTTSIALLLCWGTAPHFVYADTSDESSPTTVQDGTNKSEEDANITVTNESSSIEEKLPSSSDESPLKRTAYQAVWGTASYAFDESTGTLTVNNGIISSDITGIDKMAVKNIVFDYGVVAPTALEGVFTQFNNLVSISGALDTHNVIDMLDAFYNLRQLTSIDLSGWDTSNVTNMDYMFSYDDSLTSLDLSGWDTSNVMNMKGVFENTLRLKSLELSGWNTSNVTTMYAMFNGVDSLTSIDVSNWNTSNVTNMDSMFQGAHSLTNLDVSNWNTSNVTNMDYMFFNASGLMNLDVSNWNTSNVTKMDYMFSYDDSLTSLDLSGWDTSNITDMNGMFKNTPLSTLTLGTKSIFSVSDTELPAIEISPLGNTGKWSLTDGTKEYDSSTDFMNKYDGSKPGTYVWQVTNPSTSNNENNSGTSTSVVVSSSSTTLPTSSGSYSNSNLPKTGDGSSTSSIVLGLCLSFISLLTLGFTRKRNK